MKKMTIIGLVAMVLLTGCGKSEMPEATLEPEGVETILTENIETEEIEVEEILVNPIQVNEIEVKEIETKNIVERAWDKVVVAWNDYTYAW